MPTTYTQQSNYLFDCHCHLSPRVTKAKFECLKRQLRKKLQDEPNCRELEYPCINLMSTNHVDYKLIEELAEEFPDLVNPNFGIHPYFAHIFSFTKNDDTLPDIEIKRKHYSSVLLPRNKEFSDNFLAALPVPMYIGDYIDEVEALLQKWPGCGLGEIGIDKSFRVPKCGYLGAQECQEFIRDPRRKSTFSAESEDGTQWSGFRTQMDHQVKVMMTFMDLAKKYHRCVSVHCVSNHGKLCNLLEHAFLEEGDDTYNYSWIDLHSYSGSVDQAKIFTRTFPGIKFSISKVLNLQRYKKQLTQALAERAIRPENILLETDLGMDGLYNDDEDSGERYEFFVNHVSDDPLNRHTELLKETMDELNSMNDALTLDMLNDNFREYLHRG